MMSSKITTTKYSKSTQRRKKQTQNFDNTAQFRPQRVRSTFDPPAIDTSIKVVKRIQIQLPFDAEASLGDCTTAILMAGVPGGLTYWNRVRFERFEIWSNSSLGTDTLSVLVNTQDDWSQPTVSFVDTGTYGARRASVAFKLGLLDRSRWFSTADTTVLFTAKVDTGGPGMVVVQATVELLSGSLF